jgi:hypothetical protein
MWQDTVVVGVAQRPLMRQAVLTLAQRVDPAADRGHALAESEMQSLHGPE